MALFIVKHPKLCLRVAGKLQQVPVGSEIELTETQAEKLVESRKVYAKTEAKKVVVGKAESDDAPKAKAK
jgi:hypothetical protein